MFSKGLFLRCAKRCHCVEMGLLFTTQSRLFTTLKKKAFESIVGKGENAGYQHFLLFPQCFLPFQKHTSSFESHLFCRLQMLLIWTSLKIWRLVEIISQGSRCRSPLSQNATKKINVAQDFFIWRQCVATTFCRVT